MAMAQEQYRARAAQLHAQSKLEQDPERAALMENVAACFQQLADTPLFPLFSLSGHAQHHGAM